jgi:hypothetical protein
MICLNQLNLWLIVECIETMRHDHTPGTSRVDDDDIVSEGFGFGHAGPFSSELGEDYELPALIGYDDAGLDASLIK